MLADLAALTPPFLVCAAFLIAVGAFLRHEMRATKSQADEQPDEVEHADEIDHVGQSTSREGR